MTRSEWYALERGLIAGTVAAPLMRELLRAMARKWFCTYQNVDGVPARTVEIRAVIDIEAMKAEEKS